MVVFLGPFGRFADDLGHSRILGVLDRDGSWIRSRVLLQSVSSFDRRKSSRGAYLVHGDEP